MLWINTLGPRSNETLELCQLELAVLAGDTEGHGSRGVIGGQVQKLECRGGTESHRELSMPADRVAKCLPPRASIERHAVPAAARHNDTRVKRFHRAAVVDQPDPLGTPTRAANQLYTKIGVNVVLLPERPSEVTIVALCPRTNQKGLGDSGRIVSQ